jgi:uncharacterized protein YoaH (UPF0181 family)
MIVEASVVLASMIHRPKRRSLTRLNDRRRDDTHGVWPAAIIRAMPWNADYFPSSMRHLSPATREKAIEIANALLEEGMPEGKAIRIAIAKAKQWADAHGVPVRDDE